MHQNDSGVSSGDGGSSFDWSRFLVRFVFGAIPGALAGWGFWVQMCRPPETLGLMEGFPRLVCEWLNLEKAIDSGSAALVVIAGFASVAGLIVAVWPSISHRFSGL